MLSERLGIPFERIRLLQGDSDELIAGGGTGGSKSIMASGAAIVKAGAEVIERGREIAAHMLEAGVADVEFSRGRFTIAGTDRGIGVMELAERLAAGETLPEGVPRTLDVRTVFESAPSAYPNGCHVAEVEVDPETGVTAVVRYVMVNDFGTIINPLLVEGQLHGGVVQGIGQALMERTVYDDAGQLVTGSYMDYQLPRAADAPFFAFESRPRAGDDEPARRQGLRRSRLRRLAAGGDERARRRVARGRRQARRHAGDPAGSLGGDPGGALNPLAEGYEEFTPARDLDAPSTVMAGLGPAIHAFLAASAAARVKMRMCAHPQAFHRKPHRPAQAKSWIPGPSPGMTKGAALVG